MDIQSFADDCRFFPDRSERQIVAIPASESIPRARAAISAGGIEWELTGTVDAVAERHGVAK
jgi:hypothetical protein